ncbi:Uncharacterised protein [Mycobacteroides abscessus subsp. abscessus]|nr:Uncharacterised protein [Mycobacteroides abscessus subsp. abscessus]
MYWAAAATATWRSTEPSSANASSTATTTDSASVLKNRRAAGRVSEMPNPSAPSVRYVPGTHGLICSGTACIQSETATLGPWAPSSAFVTYGTPLGRSG